MPTYSAPGRANSQPGPRAVVTQYFLGVDIGGTKSHALIADDQGRAVGFGVGGPGNHEMVGWDGMTAALVEIVGQAILSAGISRRQIAGAGYGIAGYDWPSQRPSVIRCLEPLGIDAPYEVVNDCIVGLLAGAPQGWGVALVAGTGTNCRGWDQKRREGRVTGGGMLFGENAGGGELAWRAVQAINAEWSRRGPSTRLSTAFMEIVGARDLFDFIEGISLGRYRIDAEAAPTVFQVAAEGDVVAQELIAWAGRELGNLALGVIRQLGFESLDFDVVLVGSLYDGGSPLIDPLRETIHAVAPGARLLRLGASPVVGGVVLGMELAGLDPHAVREPLIESTRALLEQRRPA